MKSILYVGMDVHSTQYTLCTFSLGDEDVRFEHTVTANYKQILVYLERIRTKVAGLNGDVKFICGYEAGCLGYSLYKDLTEHHVKCVILAPSTMLLPNGKKKNDKRDAKRIARSLAYRTYHPVYVPDEEDESIKEYIRMREDHRKALLRVKQQTLAFCLRHGFRYSTGSNRTIKHLDWLRSLKLKSMLQETLDEYLITYYTLSDKLNRMDQRIEELAQLPRYIEKVKKLTCFLGVRTHTALGVIVEISDFKRFAKAEKYASYLGLVPGEFSSGEKRKRLGITKAGNSHVRRLMIQSAQSIGGGRVGYKSKALKKRQCGNSAETIAYADRANERLRRKYYRMMSRGVKRNVIITAIARELSCFMWGMMTDHVA